MKIDRVKLITFMAEKNISVAELASRSGLSVGTISMIRSGKSCTIKTAEAIAGALLISVKALESEVPA